MNNTILLYDGECGLCQRSVQWILKYDKKEIIYFAPLQSETGKKILAQNSMPGDYSNSLVLSENGVISTKSKAVEKIGLTLGGIWKFLAIIAGIVPRSFKEYVYSIIAKNRHIFFKNNLECRIDLAKNNPRFIRN
jgi:predicted DCC family thiol-disulfide oxidoreductase YuxK